jgi:hypothetical protein
MLPSPVPADPGPDEDLAWLDRDPERQCWLDRVCEDDDPPALEEYEDYAPLTEEELSEIEDAAADELLAIEAATSGRRGPGQPGSARVFPGEASSPAAAFGPGMAFDVMPGCAQLAVAADAAAEDDWFDGVSEAELIGVKDSRPAPPAAPSPPAASTPPASPARPVPGRPGRPRRGSLPGSP